MKHYKYTSKKQYLSLQVLHLRLHSLTVLDACPSQEHEAVVDPGIEVENKFIPIFFLYTDL